jgi:sortase A
MFRRFALSYRSGRIVVSSLLCLGFWQFGQGAYIWTRTEDSERAQPPWPWADTHPVARLSAKGGDIELIVLEGGSGRTLAFGPGHLSISVLPGERGNSIIAGHRDTHFLFLQHMKRGETIQVELPDGRRHLYQVTEIDVVDSRRGSLVLDTDTPTLSLVTCYPFNALDAGGPMRYVVSATMIF